VTPSSGNLQPRAVITGKRAEDRSVNASARAIDGDRRYQQCPVCRRWFELTPGVHRADKLTCSQACRTRAYRHRQEKAVQLHAEGRTVRQIAKEIGSDVKTVRGWIQNSGRKGK
jgi:DNA-binding NarL/FixJ family response regulator